MADHGGAATEWRPPQPGRPWLLFLGDGERLEVDSARATMDAVQQRHGEIGPEDYPELLSLVREPNAYPGLCVGVGRERVPLMWWGSDIESARSLSDRPEDALLDDEEHELSVRDAGDDQWFMPSELVDRTAATAALVQFLATGQRPDAVAWDDV